jgi:hypothetical protein
MASGIHFNSPCILCTVINNITNIRRYFYQTAFFASEIFVLVFVLSLLFFIIIIVSAPDILIHQL